MSASLDRLTASVQALTTAAGTLQPPAATDAQLNAQSDLIDAATAKVVAAQPAL